MIGRVAKPTTPRIKLGGVYLDAVQTRVEDGRSTDSVALMGYPKTHHSFVIDDTGVTLRAPALTLLQLCFDGVIPADRSKPLALVIKGHIEGEFVVEWLRRVDGFQFGEPVLLRLKRA